MRAYIFATLILSSYLSSANREYHCTGAATLNELALRDVSPSFKVTAELRQTPLGQQLSKVWRMEKMEVQLWSESLAWLHCFYCLAARRANQQRQQARPLLWLRLMPRLRPLLSLPPRPRPPTQLFPLTPIHPPLPVRRHQPIRQC